MTHPYSRLPDHCFWKRGVAGIALPDVDPVVRGRFLIDRNDRVATAGSCFAQHIARHLSAAGFNYFVTEELNPVIPAAVATGYNYGTFTARYGNLYTARQFLQLLRRAYGLFNPTDDVWIDEDGRCFDPYRPQIQPNGFACLREFHADRAQHYRAVRTAVEQCNVFVFTLGLTEAWINTKDGAVYPVCPGTAAGVFDPTRHRFVNFRMQEVLNDIRDAFDFIRERNPGVRFVVTVSPVPLVATAEDRHVLVSTTYSKSVLRAVCGELEADSDDVAYFPSYEIITGNYNRGAYYNPDLREVTETGVRHVMRLFMRHYAAAETASDTRVEPRDQPDSARGDAVAQVIEAAAKVVCDEEVLGRPVAAESRAGVRVHA